MTDLILKNYVKWTNKTCAKLKTADDDVMHMLLGMVTEVGELADVFKKNLAYNKPIDWTNVEEELGDLMFYIASFCRMTGIDLEDAILLNVNKLEERYKNGFSEEEAKNRDLDKERKILERKE